MQSAECELGSVVQKNVVFGSVSWATSCAVTVQLIVGRNDSELTSKQRYEKEKKFKLLIGYCCK